MTDEMRELTREQREALKVGDQVIFVEAYPTAFQAPSEVWSIGEVQAVTATQGTISGRRFLKSTGAKVGGSGGGWNKFEWTIYPVTDETLKAKRDNYDLCRVARHLAKIRQTLGAQDTYKKLSPDAITKIQLILVDAGLM